MYWGIMVLVGPVSSIKLQKYQIFIRFLEILLYIGVFFYLTSEIWLRKDIKPDFQPRESDSGVRISKK